jgi:hypothetical protein
MNMLRYNDLKYSRSVWYDLLRNHTHLGAKLICQDECNAVEMDMFEMIPYDEILLVAKDFDMKIEWRFEYDIKFN